MNSGTVSESINGGEQTCQQNLRNRGVTLNWNSQASLRSGPVADTHPPPLLSLTQTPSLTVRYCLALSCFKAHSRALGEWGSISIKKKREPLPSSSCGRRRPLQITFSRRRRRRSIVCLKRNGQGIQAYFCGFTVAHALRSVLDNPRFFFCISLFFKYCSGVIMCVLFSYFLNVWGEISVCLWRFVCFVLTRSWFFLIGLISDSQQQLGLSYESLSYLHFEQCLREMSVH